MKLERMIRQGAGLLLAVASLAAPAFAGENPNAGTTVKLRAVMEDEIGVRATAQSAAEVPGLELRWRLQAGSEFQLQQTVNGGSPAQVPGGVRNGLDESLIGGTSLEVSAPQSDGADESTVRISVVVL